MEVRYSPMLHTRSGLKLTSVVEAVLAGLRAAHDTLGVESAVILCGIRNISPESSLEMAELAVAYKGRGVVGFDLAGAEYDHPAKHHKKAFQLVRDNNINTTIHAGEAYGPESIAQAIHVCGAHRIGHGCRLREDGDLLHYINDHRIPLECCPSSNVQTGAVRDLATHPLKLYFDLGLRVTINTDNRLVTDTTVSQELWHCHTKMGMSLRDIKTMIVAGFKSAFLPFHVKQAYLRRVTEELERFLPDGQIKPMPPTSGRMLDAFAGRRVEIGVKPSTPPNGDVAN
jgi:adenosine deaminase